MYRPSWDTMRLAAACAAVAAVTLLYRAWLDVSNPAIVALTLLLVVLVTAATARLWVAVVVSIVSMLCLNFYFLPPVGTFTIADPQNWVALFVFVTVSLVASNLSAVARTRTAEAVGSRDELARLFDLSRDVLVMTESREAIATVARSVARRFDLASAAIALPRAGGWEVFGAGKPDLALDDHQLTEAFEAAQQVLEFDAHTRAYSGQRTVAAPHGTVRLVPLRMGTRAIGLLAASGRPVEPGTLDALAGLVAIAIERAHLLEERRAADLTRRSEELKSALLASLAHDLRTPLTAIRIAASNLQGGSLTGEDRGAQADLILGETERLGRLFQNILEMARIDAGNIDTDLRWAYPSEIVAAARSQVEHTLSQHVLDVVVDRDVPVRVDPRLTATAAAQVLENAAHHAPAGSVITIAARVDAEGLTIRVGDRGPGVAAVDLPHLFERFYRGAGAKERSAGTGMGLTIARGLLAAERGRIWAENRPDGGAEFTIHVPAAVKGAEPADAAFA